MKWFNPQALSAQKYSLQEENAFKRLHQNEGGFISDEEKNWWKNTSQNFFLNLMHEEDKNNSKNFLFSYPSLEPKNLIHSFSKFISVSEQCIEVTCGSSQAFDLIALSCFKAGKKIAIPKPSFSLYSNLAKLYECQLVSIELENFQYTEKCLLSDEVLKADVVIVCTPNNPTGTVCSSNWLVRLCEQSKGLVVVDEAYFDFVMPGSMHRGFLMESLSAYVQQFKNLIVVRTLSKAHSAAGLRLGFLISCKENIQVFKAIRPPYSIPFLTEYFGEKLISEGSVFLKKRVEFINHSRTRIEDKLTSMNKICVHTFSLANFVFFKVLNSESANAWKEIFTKDFHLNVRFFSNIESSLEGCFRISFATPEDVECVLKALSNIQNKF
jgi:histidinol-phosphate aminotransferase